jgi:putative tributyrin esterase
MAYGGRYFDYVADELPVIMRSFFHFSNRREDNFVAGLSMGGYGAFKLALTRPEQYAAAASLSGALNIATLAERQIPALEAGKTPDRGDLLKLVFGDTQRIQGSPHDLFHLLQTAKRENTNLPKLFASCGTEDFLYPDNIAFRDFAQDLGMPLTYHEAPGTHEWGYWDRTIQRVLEWLPL